jgi:hypothetical protein
MEKSSEESVDSTAVAVDEASQPVEESKTGTEAAQESTEEVPVQTEEGKPAEEPAKTPNEEKPAEVKSVEENLTSGSEMPAERTAEEEIPQTVEDNGDEEGGDIILKAARRMSAQNGTSVEEERMLKLRQFYDKRDDEAVDSGEDAAQYTDEKLLERETIRMSEPIQDKLKRLHKVIDTDHSGKLDKGEYSVMNRKLYVCVRAFWDKTLPDKTDEEYEDMAEDDWEEDLSHLPEGTNEIYFAAFGLSFFQLVGTFVHVVDDDAYNDFLEKLFHMIAVLDDGASEYRLRTDEEIIKQAGITEKWENSWCGRAMKLFNKQTLRWDMCDELGEMLHEHIPAHQRAASTFSNSPSLSGRRVSRKTSSSGRKNSATGRKNSATGRKDSATAAAAKMAAAAAVQVVKSESSAMQNRRNSRRKSVIDRQIEMMQTWNNERTTDIVLRYLKNHMQEMKSEWDPVAKDIQDHRDKLNPQKKAFKSLSVKNEESPGTAARALAKSPGTAARALARQNSRGSPAKTESRSIADSSSAPSLAAAKLDDAISLDAALNTVGEGQDGQDGQEGK